LMRALVTAQAAMRAMMAEQALKRVPDSPRSCVP